MAGIVAADLRSSPTDGDRYLPAIAEVPAPIGLAKLADLVVLVVGSLDGVAGDELDDAGRIIRPPGLGAHQRETLPVRTLGPLAGGRLRGDIYSGQIPDWSFTQDVKTIQLETNPEDPHSVNTWCGVYQGALHIPTSLILGTDEPSERAWVKNVLADPNVRLRIDGVVYELRAVRVTDKDQLEGARASLLAKYDVEADHHSSGAWVFRMEAR